MNIKIGFVGMSHLGLNYAVASAIKGYDVVCYDENSRLIDLLNSSFKSKLGSLEIQAR